MADPARINRVIDRLIDLLKEIGGDDTAWRVAFKDVTRFRSGNDFKLPMPRVLLLPQPAGPESVVRQMGGTWRESRDITAIVLSTHPTEPQREVADASADVRKRIRQLNGTLYDTDGTTLLAFMVGDTGSDLSVDPDLAAAGYGQDLVTISVTYDVGADGT